MTLDPAFRAYILLTIDDNAKSAYGFKLCHHDYESMSDNELMGWYEMFVHHAETDRPGDCKAINRAKAAAWEKRIAELRNKFSPQPNRVTAVLMDMVYEHTSDNLYIYCCKHGLDHDKEMELLSLLHPEIRQSELIPFPKQAA